MLHYSTDPDGETPQSMRSCPDDWGLGESGPDEPVAWGRLGSSSDFTHSPKNQDIITHFFCVAYILTVMFYAFGIFCYASNVRIATFTKLIPRGFTDFIHNCFFVWCRNSRTVKFQHFHKERCASLIFLIKFTISWNSIRILIGGNWKICIEFNFVGFLYI